MTTDFDATRYADLLSRARAAFLTDTFYAVKLAEDHATMTTREENKQNPEQLRANIVKLYRQGALPEEISRVVRTNEARVRDILREAGVYNPQEARRTPVVDPRDLPPAPREVIPSKRLKKWEPKPLTEDDDRHGTNNGYMNFGCRCTRCVEARKEYRAERKANPTGRTAKAEHGTHSRYARGCRCQPCKGAASEYYRKRKAQK